MQDVTEVLNRYRECARSLWNNFIRRPEPQCESVDAFHAICERLFQELVIDQLEEEQSVRYGGNEPFPFLVVVPIVDGVPIMIRRDVPGNNQYWNHPVNRVSRDGTKLLFIDYFDWDTTGFRDFRYLRVKVESLDAHPEVVGHEALLEAHNVNVYHLKGA